MARLDNSGKSQNRQNHKQKCW